jgi:hypothetical protein
MLCAPVSRFSCPFLEFLPYVLDHFPVPHPQAAEEHLLAPASSPADKAAPPCPVHRPPRSPPRARRLLYHDRSRAVVECFRSSLPGCRVMFALPSLEPMIT